MFDFLKTKCNKCGQIYDDFRMYKCTKMDRSNDWFFNKTPNPFAPANKNNIDELSKKLDTIIKLLKTKNKIKRNSTTKR